MSQCSRAAGTVDEVAVGQTFLSLWNEQRTIDEYRTCVHSVRHLDSHAPDHRCGGLSVSSKRVRAVGLVGPVRLGEVNPVSGEPDDGNIIYIGI
jgi:hypothetical protein